MQALQGLRWPEASPKTLAPKHVTLREAEAAIGTGAGNPDFRVKRTAADPVDDPVAEAVEAKPIKPDPPRCV